MRLQHELDGLLYVVLYYVQIEVAEGADVINFLKSVENDSSGEESSDGERQLSQVCVCLLVYLFL